MSLGRKLTVTLFCTESKNGKSGVVIPSEDTSSICSRNVSLESCRAPSGMKGRYSLVLTPANRTMNNNNSTHPYAHAYVHAYAHAHVHTTPYIFHLPLHTYRQWSQFDWLLVLRQLMLRQRFHRCMWNQSHTHPH